MSNQKFFTAPFALNGDKTAVPDTAQGSGAVSYAEGYGYDYERNPSSDPSALYLSRPQFNQLMYDLTSNLQQYQLNGFPEWVTAAQNDASGSAVPVAYNQQAVVRYDTSGGAGTGWVLFASLVNNNTTVPGTDPTKWVQVSFLTTPATQTQVNEGQAGDDVNPVGPIELVRAAREGRWTYAGAAAYGSVNALTAALPGNAAYSQVAGAAVSFTVPSVNTAAGMTLQLGANAAAPLVSSMGNALQPGDLQPGAVYTAKFDGVNWRMQGNVASELQQYGAQGAGFIFGLTCSNAAGALYAAVNVSLGSCRDSTNAANLTLLAAVTKRLDQPFAAGSGNGGRDTGAVGPYQTWHVFLITNTASGAVDVLFSQSATSPTLPAGFNLFRRIWSIMTDAAANIMQFVQTGSVCSLKSRTTDYTRVANGSTVPMLRKLTVPNGIRVKARLFFQCNGAVDATYHSGLFDPALGQPPNFNPASSDPVNAGNDLQWSQIVRTPQWVFANGAAGWSNRGGPMVIEQFTDTAQNVYTFSNDPSETMSMGVLGWEDSRGLFF